MKIQHGALRLSTVLLVRCMQYVLLIPDELAIVPSAHVIQSKQQLGFPLI